MTTTEDIRARLKGYSPEAAKAQEALGAHDQNKKFAPPWYELKHFRATLSLRGVEPNQNGIEQVVFDLGSLEVYDGSSPYTELRVTVPKNPPGYPTDELNLMVESAGVADATELDGLDLELELDYADHPWMKERGKEGTDIMVNGVAVPKRCWYYKTVAKYGNANTPAAPSEPRPENLKQLANWCAGQAPAEVTNASLARAAISLGIQSDAALMALLGDGTEKFFAKAAACGLVVGTEGRFEVLPLN